ncbi:MAG: PilZ domain-containing protein [Candidatus Omnitrophota bacterium]|nr:MAG: PilZ domain-containing protein [Candidatus Omnitrophota bacterium]
MEWAGPERRRFVRANFPCKITLSIPEKHVIISHTENIGAGGVRVLIPERLEVSTLVDLAIYIAEEPTICKGRVVWMVERKTLFSEEPHLYDIGIEFYEIDEESQRFIQSFVETSVPQE